VDGGRLDLGALAARAARAWWRDFAPITLLGFGLLTLPGLVAGALLGAAPATDPVWGTAVATILGILAMLFFAAVAVGVVSGELGRPLPPARFALLGMAGAAAGLPVGLLFGTAAVAVLIALRLAPLAGPVGAVAGAAALALALAGLAAWLPAIPAAVAERAGTLAALRRAARLTRGERTRLALLCLGSGIALWALASATHGFGRMGALAMTAPERWIGELVGVMALGLAASLPPAAYVELGARRRP
jgi:hypothetical protein